MTTLVLNKDMRAFLESAIEDAIHSENESLNPSPEHIREYSRLLDLVKNSFDSTEINLDGKQASFLESAIEDAIKYESESLNRSPKYIKNYKHLLGMVRRDRGTKQYRTFIEIAGDDDLDNEQLLVDEPEELAPEPEQEEEVDLDHESTLLSRAHVLSSVLGGRGGSARPQPLLVVEAFEALSSGSILQPQQVNAIKDYAGALIQIMEDERSFLIFRSLLEKVNL